jgi:hypothetical protein
LLLELKEGLEESKQAKEASIKKGPYLFYTEVVFGLRNS